MKKLKKLFFDNLIVLLALVMLSSIASAQTCPQGKVVVIWVNGILGKGEVEWTTNVNQIAANFYATHPGMQQAGCVEFVPVFNQSAWLGLADLLQSLDQLGNLKKKTIDLTDDNMRALLTKIGDYSGKGYKVVLVGHSQGSLYINIAYEYIREALVKSYVPSILSLPDNNKLEIVNIATPSGRVSDGNGRYTTTCGDVILKVGGSLRANVNSEKGKTCLSQGFSFDKHALDNYMIPGSETQKQIYADLDLALRLQDPGCAGATGCQLNENFSDSNVATNFIVNPYDMGLVKKESGAMLLSTALTGDSSGAFTVNKGIARTRRVFSGNFTASFSWKFVPNSTGVAKFNFVRSYDNASKFELDLDASTISQTLSIIKSGSRIVIFKNGIQIKDFSLDGEYYLRFEVQGPIPTPLTIATPSTLQIKDLYVGATPKRDTPYREALGTVSAQVLGGVYTGLVSCTLNGASIYAPFTMTGKEPGSYTLSCTAPSGYNVAPNSSSPSVATLPSGGILTFGVNVTPKPPPPPTTGTVRAISEAYLSSGPLSCLLNGESISAPFTITKPAGTYTLTCVRPTGYSVTITPASQILSVDKIIIFTMVVKLLPDPVITGITVNTSPKVNTAINVTVNGTGFFSNVRAYACTGTDLASCSQTSMIFVDSTKVTLTNVRSSIARTLYIRIFNPEISTSWSNYKSLVVIN